uniref:Structural maintenance of chromosomes protein n=1 Tax=Culicoides sonorensis TaxID=179676 RepID=A0A336KQ15_CULSO
MYIKSVIIDGFKSYGRRTEIHGFDPEFNAITGLNGTGKSNILDSICFVLGISNLGQVRATSLQELVYKSGQAGVTRATVTIVFDNSDKDQAPVGFEKCSEISVARTIIVGGKNKYMINGKSVQNKRVQDLFCSVQLNVNNPNFLIMQGRITKVLNMKPHEILSMIEEAAGTSLYETKREASLKMIEKKDAKLAELNTLIHEEAEPRLDKLRKDREQYEKFKKVERDIDYLQRLYISHQWLKLQEAVKNSEGTIQSITKKIEEHKQKITSNLDETKVIDEETKALQAEMDTDTGGAIKELEEDLSKLSKSEASVSGKRNAAKENINLEQRKLKQLQKSIKDDEIALLKKEAEYQKVGSMFEELKKTNDDDAKAAEEAEKRYEAVCSGLSVNEDGQAASLQDQLIAARSQVNEANTTIKTSEMELKHTQKLYNDKQKQVNVQDSVHVRETKVIQETTKKIQLLTNELSNIHYEDGSLEALQNTQLELSNEARNIKRELAKRNSHRFDFTYKDPEPNFDRRRVKGMLGKLVRVKDRMFGIALNACGGGSLYSIVTDTQVTGKLILERGQLQNRVTIVPLNKVNSGVLHSEIVRKAQQIAGRDNVWSALSLVEYDEDVAPAVQFAFGYQLVCRNLEIAKRLAYDKQINSICVTLEGDFVNPEGTLSGGARMNRGCAILEMNEIVEYENRLVEIQHELNQLERQIAQVENVAGQYNQIRQKLDQENHNLNAATQRLANTTFNLNQQEIDDLKTKCEELKQAIATAKESLVDGNRKVKDVEEKLADAKGYRERELKSAEENMKKARKKSDESSKKWKQREREYETLKLSIEDLKTGIATSKEQLSKLEQTIQTLVEDCEKLEEESAKASSDVTELKARIKEMKDKMAAQNKDIKQKLARKERLIKQNQDLELDIKKQENEINKVRNDNKTGYDNIHALENKYPWISEEKQFFGSPKTRYDYTATNPIEAGKKLKVLMEEKEKLGRNLNQKAMSLVEQEETLFNQLLKRRGEIEKDKKSLFNAIKNLDEKKKKELKKAWDEVNANFGGIFSSILPGTQAKLVPPQGQDFLKGLEVKIGFNGLWKESLTELSGGQRSLVALSLILAMLKYKPAPLYILDEVDAALDLSHTQNIGNMLKHHFTNSQFVIVSLKDGMFNNANVLFRTKFVDGMSGVTRTVNPNLHKK